MHRDKRPGKLPARQSVIRVMHKTDLSGIKHFSLTSHTLLLKRKKNHKLRIKALRW